MKHLAFALTAAVVLAGVSIAAAAGFTRDGAVLQNSGSTNFSGYTIKVWSDASAWAVRSTKAGQPQGAAFTGEIPKSLADKFFADVRAAKKSGGAIGRGCMKSVSFGSSTTVLYHGWRSADLECPAGGYVMTLAADVHQIAAALHVQPAPRRPLMPNEPRRPEAVPSQASATPESTPPLP